MKFSDLKKQSNIKVLLEGKSGRGKTRTACGVALRVLQEDREVLYVDTEAEGSETLVNLIEGGEYEESVVENLEYVRVKSYEALKEQLEIAGNYDLVVVDTLDHKHSFVLKHVTDAKRASDADWNEYASIYSEEKEFMGMLGDPDTNVIATLDPDSGKRDKPKGAQTNIRGYFSVVLHLRKEAEDEWGHKVLNWVGKSEVIGKKVTDLEQGLTKQIIQRSE